MGLSDTLEAKEKYRYDLLEQGSKGANPQGYGWNIPSFSQFPYESSYKEHGSPIESWYDQRHLPEPLQFKNTYPGLQAGIQNIGELMRNPGGLGGGLADAIRPRLASESESIAQQFRNLMQNQQGALARGNAPVSIKAALEQALGINQERAQRGARREAIMDSEQLRRQDTDQTYKLLQTILQFIQSGRGQATSQQAFDAQEKQSDDAKTNALIGAIGSLLAPATGGASLAAAGAYGAAR